MKKIIFLLVILTIFLGATSKVYSQTPNCNNLVGVWHNQLKSTLTIKSINPTTGEITGTYKSPSGTGGTPVPLIGWVNKKPPVAGKDNVVAIQFSVNWGTYGSITSWTGHCQVVDGVPTIKTLWHLVRANTDFTWDHILSNSDTFTPGPPKP